MKNIPVQIYVQPTPNPEALKFILSQDVKTSGKATFVQGDVPAESVLAKDLLNLNGIEQIHFFENVITVTKNSLVAWEDLEFNVRAVIETRMPVHNPNFGEKLDEIARRQSLSPEHQKIEEILDRTVRPGLQGDGGDIQVLELDGKILRVRYEGACGTCPSSTSATMEAIEGILRAEFDPEIVIEVH
ncbi:MAG: NifU family protein [Bdellovibrionales bacterium CG10_big_fil_rev_8_21_14_0_10_45_34]|nr:MAG: NifU family protein [Bdellovibrionales bacterium CG10_big_fil_rev_8_21_14_0_10_45_34]